MSFCGEYVTYPSCVPPSNPIWPTWNVTSKDAIIESLFTDLVDKRIQRESESLINATEYIDIRFLGNEACVSNFKKIICYFNFPQCNYPTAGTSNADYSFVQEPLVVVDRVMDEPQLSVLSTFPLCGNTCKGYFTQCRFEEDMVSAFCTANSVWPMAVSDMGSLNSSKLVVNDGQGQCTGKSAKIPSITISFVIFFVLVLRI